MGEYVHLIFLRLLRMFAIVAKIATFSGNPLLCQNIFAIFAIVCIC